MSKDEKLSLYQAERLAEIERWAYLYITPKTPEDQRLSQACQIILDLVSKLKTK